MPKKNMSLKEYERKRDFSKTPEPSCKAEKKKDLKLQFGVHKHAASHLHYDLRLEVEGVLKSWAIPKGPSLNPEDKQLAIMVEDHPLDYIDFEGIIPPGNYGAGSVMLWDRGTYTPLGVRSRAEGEKKLLEGIKNGRMSFYLCGKKLQGEFTLVKLKFDKTAKNSTAKKNNWLLVKKDDEFASREDVRNRDRSVSTGRSTEEINSSVDKQLNLNGVEKVKMPMRIEPMAARLIEKPFDDPSWIFEIKLDGYRILAKKEDKKIELFSRKGLLYNLKFPNIVNNLIKIPYNVFFDGEIVALDKQGISNFALLQEYIKRGQGIIVYYIFDILYYKDSLLFKVPLRNRKKILRWALPSFENIKYLDHIDTYGLSFFNKVKEEGLEGIIAKDAQSYYTPGIRSNKWLKIKAVQEQEAVIAGFTEAERGRRYFRSLILGNYDKGELKYVGHVGGGFSEETLLEIKKKLEPLILNKCPFKKVPKTNAKAVWVKPKLVCQIKFSEWTQEGYMRQPIFLGLREDKSPQEVEREAPRSMDLFAIKNKKINLSNLDKTFWPDKNLTKQDLINYYEKISSIILPYLKDRPESLHRFPNGIYGKSFYQKNITNCPEWVKTEKIYSETEAKEINYLICQNEETLLYLANLGCIELNPWNSRLENIEKPDYLVLDFDPHGLNFKYVVKAAQVTGNVLKKIKMQFFCKTSGARGLHIYIPLGANYDYEQTRNFAKLLYLIVSKQIPLITSLERTPNKREKKIYLDYLQNRKGQTMASAYSLRPLKGAPVSTPLEWEEVNQNLRPLSFNIETIFKRLKKKGDLWEGLSKNSIDMLKSIELLEKVLK